MHVIVGQGQLDAVLSGRPEDRRAFIEEAAGVLKHRKRKEKALRKLDGMRHNLDRLADLTAELRRQLKPLGKQAEVARRAAGVQADLRDARLRLLADDLVQLRDALDKDVADETAAREKASSRRAGRRVAARVGARARARGQAPLLRRRPGHLVPALRPDRAVPWRRAAGRRAAPAPLRRRAPAAAAGRDPDQLDAEADRVPRHRGGAAPRAGGRPARLAGRRRRARSWRRRSPRPRRRWVAAARALADRREGLARLSGEVAAARSRVAAGQAEIERLAARRRRGRRPRRGRRRAAGRPPSPGRRAEDATSPSSPRTRRPSPRTPRPPAVVTELTEAERAAEQDRASWQARREALALGLPRRRRPPRCSAPTWPACSARSPTLLTVRGRGRGRARRRAGRHGRRRRGAGVAEAAPRSPLLKDADGGRAGLLVDRRTAARHPRDGWPALPDGVRWALDVVEAPAELRPALARALERVAVVADLDAAVALVARTRGPRGHRRDGDLVGADWAVGGVAGRRPPTSRCRRGSTRRRPSCAAAEARLPRWPTSSRRAGGGAAQVAEVDAALAARQAAEGGRAPPSPASSPSSGPRPGRPPRRPSRLAAARPRRGGDLEQAEGAGRPGGAARRRRGRAGRGGTVHRGARPAARRGRRGPSERDRGAARRPDGRGTGPALAGRAESLRRQARQERAARERPRPHGPPGRAAPIAPAVALGAERALARVGPARPAAGERDQLADGPGSPRAELHGVRARVRLRRRTSSGSPTRCTATRWPGPSSGCGSSSWRPGRRGVGLDLPTRCSPSTGRPTPVPPTAPEVAAAETAGGRCPSRCRTTRAPGEAGRQGRARAGPAGQGQPAGAGGVRGAGGAVQSSSPTSSRTSRARAATCSPWSRTSTTGSSRSSPAAFDDTAREFEQVFARAVPGRRGPAGAHRPRGHAHHRRRGRGAAAGQEDQAAVAAVRRRAVADRGRDAGGDLPGPAQRRSTSWTRSRRRWTT